MRQRVGWLFIAILLPIPLLTVSLQPIPAATEESAVSAQASGVPGPSRHGERLPAVSSRAFPTEQCGASRPAGVAPNTSTTREQVNGTKFQRAM